MLTNDQRRKLAMLAGAMALEAPEKESAGMCARIPWPLVNKVRAILAESGFDWRAECRSVHRARAHEEWESLAPANRGPEPPKN